VYFTVLRQLASSAFPHNFFSSSISIWRIKLQSPTELLLYFVSTTLQITDTQPF
jgi:hypothetical protein